LGLGDSDQAFAWLEQAYKEQSNILLFLKVLPFFDPLRDEFKLGFHNLSPAVIFKNCIGTFFKSTSFSLREVLFLVFRKDRNEKNGNRVIALDIDNARPTALTFSPARNAKFAKSTSSFHDFPILRISSNRQNNVGTLFLAEEFFSSREVSGRFNNRLHYSFVLHWTPAVKKNGIPLDTNGFHSKALTSGSR